LRDYDLAFLRKGGCHDGKIILLAWGFKSRHAQLPLWMADQIGDDVGVEQVTHDRSTGLGIGSEIGGKSSSSGDNVARTASSDLRGATSIISFSPLLAYDGVLARPSLEFGHLLAPNA